MSFKTFKEDLLVALAIVAEAKATEEFEAIEVARQRKLTYREGWLRQAVNALEGYGYIRVTSFMGGGEDLGMRISLTGSGIEQAEEICNERGANVYQEIENHKVPLSPIDNTIDLVIPASDRVVKIDHNLPEYEKIVAGIDSITSAAKMNNSLKSKYPDESEQRIAELEAGKRLLDAPQANPDLLISLIIRPLKWIADKIVDNLVALTVTPLLLLIAKFLGIA